VFRLPIGDEVAFGQVLAVEDDALMHLIVFEGLHPAESDLDLDDVTSARAELYAWTSTRPFGRRWTIVDNRPVDRDSLPPVEFVEMTAPDEFQVVDYDGNPLWPATAVEVERAPFRTIVLAEAVEEAVEAWSGRRPWEDDHVALRPWDERNLHRDDAATRLLRRFRGIDEPPEAGDENGERIHYFVFEDEAAASAAEERLGELGDVRVDASGPGRQLLVTVTGTVAASSATAGLEALAEELGGVYDGAETEVRL
jgi:hypothetical protein